MSINKKIASAALTITTGVWMSGALLLVPVAQAQTVSLEAQIAALLAQIQQLQAQLNTSGSSSVSAPTFTRSLTVGSTGADVKSLQQWLNAKGYAVATSGAGSAGNETEYFGPATKAAVAKWQTAVGLFAGGFFGPQSRAKVASMSVTPPGTTPPVVTPPGTTPPVVTAPASGLVASLASSNPTAGALISSAASAAARVPVLAVSLTAGNSGAMNVSQIKFTKVGVISDSSISGAYLTESGKVIAQYNSLSGGVLIFSGLGISVGAGQTRTFELAIDPAQNLSAGNTVAFRVNAAADVSATDVAGTVVTTGGSYPLNGNTFTVTSVSNPSIATLTVASSSIGTSVTAGSQNVIAGAWTFTGGNSKVWLKGINFKVIGSANKSDLKNAKLFINGAQVGSTLASVAADGSAYFDLTSAPGAINTGANNIQLYADVMGSASFNFQFEILNSYDILAVDSQYNVPVTAASNTGTQVTISQGQITVTLASDTPTGNVAKGQSNVTFAKYNIYAAGEAVKVKWLGFSLVPTGTLGVNWDTEIKNVRMMDDAGGQLGSTISSLVTSVTCTDTAFSAATTTASNCFGSSGSPINYIVPANTTRVLSLVGDVQSGAAFASITGSLTGNTSNLQGLSSSQTASTGGATGSAMSLSATSLTVAKNTAVGVQTFAKGATVRKIGSYALTASSAESVTISNVTVLMGPATSTFQNLMVKIGSVQFGQTQTTLAAAGSYSFSGTAFTVTKGTTTYVDVYADILSSAASQTITAATTLSSCSGSGSTGTAVSCSSTAGQNLTVAGQATLTVGINSSLTPAAGQLVMGTNGVTLGAFQLSETSNVDDVKITDLNIFDVVTATSSVNPSFGNLKLYKSTDLVNAIGTAGSSNTSVATSTPGFGYYYTFSGVNLTVPQNGSISLVLKGDVATYNSNAATDNSAHTFRIATSTDTANDSMGTETVNAKGSTSNASSSVVLASGGAAANTLTVLRTKLTASAAALGAASSRSKLVSDDFATITFAADAADNAYLNTLTVTFSGTAPSISTFLAGVTLLDANAVNVTSTSGVTATSSATACNGTNTCTKTWSFGTTTAGWQVSGASSYVFKLRVDSTKTLAGASGVVQGLGASINANTDVMFTGGLSGTPTSSIALPVNVAPINLNSVSYVSGS